MQLAIISTWMLVMEALPDADKLGRKLCYMPMKPHTIHEVSKRAMFLTYSTSMAWVFQAQAQQSRFEEHEKGVLQLADAV